MADATHGNRHVLPPVDLVDRRHAFGGGVELVLPQLGSGRRIAGAELWEYKLDAATEGVPAVYEANGRQYVTIPVGGVGHFANNLGLGEPGPNKYVTFALPAGAARR